MEFVNTYVLTERDNKRISRDIDDIAAGGTDLMGYLCNSIKTLNTRDKTYMHYFADREQLVACSVMDCFSYCKKYVNCKGCPLEGAWINARKEIATGKRRKTYTKVNRGCRTHISVDKNGTVHIMQYM